MPRYRTDAAEHKVFTYQARLIVDPTIEAALEAYAGLCGLAERCLFAAIDRGADPDLVEQPDPLMETGNAATAEPRRREVFDDEPIRPWDDTLPIGMDDFAQALAAQRLYDMQNDFSR